MKFDYMVKFNGIYYNAGEEVPMGTSSKPADEKVVEEKAVEKTEKPKKTKAKAE